MKIADLQAYTASQCDTLKQWNYFIVCNIFSNTNLVLWGSRVKEVKHMGGLDTVGETLDLQELCCL